MRLGLIVRGESRGLGTQTWDWYRHLSPAKTLLVDMGQLARGFKMHAERYPGATCLSFDGHRLPEPETRAWLEGLDCVMSAETMYDWRICDWAREAGVATVCVANPEFFVHHQPDRIDCPRPTTWWAPTSWRLEHLPEDTRVVPHPVAPDRFEWAKDASGYTGPLRVLHVAGHHAYADRNGTLVVLQALRLLRKACRVRIITQEPRVAISRGISRYIKYEVVTNGVANYWDLYRDADVLVLPRKYGGLSLQAQEAMAAGLGLVMTDCEPQTSTWPILPIRSRLGAEIRPPGGPITIADPLPHRLADLVDSLADDSGAVAMLQKRARAWAQANSWEALLPLYETELKSAIGANASARG